jgi:hypothetical protein
LHELVKCCARKRLRVLAQVTSRSCRAGDDLKAEEATCSLDAVVEAEIRNSSRPGSQAPHAPPALTFGLPGKQSVKHPRWGRVLTRHLGGLPRNRRNFADPALACRGSARPGQRREQAFSGKIAPITGKMPPIRGRSERSWLSLQPCGHYFCACFCFYYF